MLNRIFNPAFDEKNNFFSSQKQYLSYYLVVGNWCICIQTSTSEFCSVQKLLPLTQYEGGVRKKNEFLLWIRTLRAVSNVGHMFEKYVMDLHMIQFISIVENVFEKQPI